MLGLIRTMSACAGATVAFLMSGALAAGEAPLARMQNIDTTPGIAVAALEVPGQNDAADVAGRDASLDTTIVGAASFYDDPGETASGEAYDPDAFTAAAQLKIRDKFGGIKFGRLYQPYYGVAEYAGKKLIIKFNDVGPLRPGRMFDLSRAAMKYFDGSLEKGVLPDVKVTVLPPGRVYEAGPVTDEQLAALGFAAVGFKLASAEAGDAIASTVQAVPSQVGLADGCAEPAGDCANAGATLMSDLRGSIGVPERMALLVRAEPAEAQDAPSHDADVTAGKQGAD